MLSPWNTTFFQHTAHPLDRESVRSLQWDRRLYNEVAMVKLSTNLIVCWRKAGCPSICFALLLDWFLFCLVLLFFCFVYLADYYCYTVVWCGVCFVLHCYGRDVNDGRIGTWLPGLSLPVLVRHCPPQLVVSCFVCLFLGTGVSISLRQQQQQIVLPVLTVSCLPGRLNALQSESVLLLSNGRCVQSFNSSFPNENIINNNVSLFSFVEGSHTQKKQKKTAGWC